MWLPMVQKNLLPPSEIAPHQHILLNVIFWVMA